MMRKVHNGTSTGTSHHSPRGPLTQVFDPTVPHVTLWRRLPWILSERDAGRGKRSLSSEHFLTHPVFIPPKPSTTLPSV